MVKRALLLFLFLPFLAHAQTYPTCGTVATTNASGVPTSGDTGVHAPPSYTTFVPPGIAGLWGDQQYGCVIEQLTAALTDGFPGGSPKTEHHFYINTPLNLSNNRVIIIDNNGSMYVLDTSGHRIITSAAFPSAANNGGSGIYWSRQSGTPNTIYYKRSTGGNLSLQKADTSACTSGSPCSSLTFTTVFTQACASWNTNNEDDMRTDGAGHDFVGWDCGTTYSVVNATAGTQGTTFTNTQSVNNYKIGRNSAGTMFMCLSMNSGTSGSGSAGNAAQGTWCYNGSTGASAGQATTSAQHANLVYDPAVSKLFWVQEQSGNEIPAWNPCHGTITSGVEEIESANWGTATHVCVWNWPTPSPQGFCVQGHVSGSDYGVAGYEVYSGTTSCNSSPALFNPFVSMDPSYASDWIAFYGDILVLGTSNNKIYRVAQHRSRMNNGGVQDYWAQPRNSLSIDATKLVFDSNQIQGCCSSPAYVANYSDVYMVSLQAGNVYVAQSAGTFVGGVLCNGQTAITPASISWAAGHTYVLCGTITFSTNVSGLTVGASGAPTAPITILADTGAILQSPQFHGGANGPVGPGAATKAGGIVIPDGTTYVILDGAGVGIIQNTANGNGMTNDTASLGIYDGGDYTIIRNWTIKNIYQWPSGPQNDTNGGMSADIWTNGAANYLKVCNNILYGAQSGLQVQTANTITTSYTPATEPCSVQTFANTPNIEISYNTFDDHAWMALINGSGRWIIHNNQFGSMYKNIGTNCTIGNCGWYNWTGAPASFHEDGLFTTGHGASVSIPQIFNNLFEGDTSAESTTTGLYCSYVPGQDYGSQCQAYNNICYAPNQGAFTSSDQGNTFCNAFATDPVNIDGPHKFYNNTIIGATNFGNNGSISGVGIDFQNNIQVSNNTVGSIGFFWGNGSSGQTFASNLNWNNNLYAGSREAVVGPNGGFDTWASGPVSFANWKTQCNASTATGCDSASAFNTSRTYPVFQGQVNISADANITDGSNFYILASSPARSLGANLTSQCTTLIALCTTAPEFFGVNSTCGTGCKARPAMGAWDAGAYSFLAGAWNPDQNGRDYINGGQDGKSYNNGLNGLNGRKYP